MDDQEKMEKWEKMRSKGLIRFILEIGILKWALPTAIITQIGFYIMDHGFTFDYLGQFFTARNNLFFLFGTWLSAGVFFGLSMWNAAEYNYRKLKRQVSK